MSTNRIDDENFGSLVYEDGWGWCSKKFLWFGTRYTSICFSEDCVINSAISENSVRFLNHLQENELMILNQALEKLDCYDRINEWISEGAEDVVFDAASFLRFSSLDWVFIDPNGDSEFQYISGGPLLRIFISQDINVLDTFFDGLM